MKNFLTNVRLVMGIVGAIGLIAVVTGMILFFTKNREMVVMYSLVLPGAALMLLAIAYETKLFLKKK